MVGTVSLGLDGWTLLFDKTSRRLDGELTRARTLLTLILNGVSMTWLIVTLLTVG